MSQNSNQTESTEAAATPEGDSDGGKLGTTRRRMLAGTAATWATASVAGCGGDGGDTPEPTPADTDTPVDTETETPEQPENFVVTDDMAAGSEGVPTAQWISSCSPSRRFVPGMQAIWYVGVYNPETGEQLTDEDLSGVEINVDGLDENVELGWAGDDEENPAQEWGGSIVLPSDLSPGTYSYTVEVSDGDANYRNVGIAANSFTVLDPRAQSYVVTNHTYGYDYPDDAGRFANVCGQNKMFAQGYAVGFEVKVFEPDSGEEVGTDVVESASISFQNRAWPTQELEWGGDAEEDPVMKWSTSFTVPEDAETGTVIYDVVIEGAEGATFHDVKVAHNDPDEETEVAEDYFKVVEA